MPANTPKKGIPTLSALTVVADGDDALSTRSRPPSIPKRVSLYSGGDSEHELDRYPRRRDPFPVGRFNAAPVVVATAANGSYFAAVTNPHRRRGERLPICPVTHRVAPAPLCPFLLVRPSGLKGSKNNGSSYLPYRRVWQRWTPHRHQHGRRCSLTESLSPYMW